jgi:hypothetical protein
VRRRIVRVAAATALAGLLLPPLALPAAAHEARKVGKYHFDVGFGDEPAYAGEKNSVQLLLSDASDKPVTDLTDTLKVAVSTEDGDPMNLALEPNFEVGEFGIPGDYRGWFIPTAPGKYTFHFTGSIKGQKVDQSFTSSPTGFDEVTDPSTAQYPGKEPTTGQLATLAQRDAARTSAALSKASDRTDSARNLAVAGLVVGVAGLLAAIGVGAFALRRRA